MTIVLTRMSHLAMSTVKEGGFFSEQCALPFKSNSHKGHQYDYPNQGNFTCHDDAIGSIMSGTCNEWNRITSLSLKNIDMNVALSLKKKMHREESLPF